MALTTFIGQNLGARQYDRAKKGAAFGIVCSMTLAELVGVIVYMLIPYLAAAFDSSAEVVGFATRPGTRGGAVLLFPGVLTLYCRNHARCRENPRCRCS